MDFERYRVSPGIKVDLSDWETDGKDGTELTKDEGAAVLAGYNSRLADLQQLLYADGRHKLLVVLQGMDSSGKDSTIKHVFQMINPLGVSVANFKPPSETELAHDYLWRVHARTPANGQITIFNRSHYEDVLVVRVHGLAPEAVWKRRYGQIIDFERMLCDEGTVMRKFFLHISKDEQKARLEERLANPAKNWKFEHGDLEERKYWDDYQLAYEVALSKTSTKEAPWYVVPSNQKWFRNLVISNVLIETLESLHLSYPPAPPGLESWLID